jgi:copper chaperone NosL
MTYKMSKLSRFITLFCAFAMIAVLFFPIWKITLTAPQYPEGLVMKIWAYKLSGSVDIINGLNHYIGMKTLHNEDFVEFKILPFIIIGYSLLGFIVFFLNRKLLYKMYVGLFLVIAFVSLGDFYRWEYNYGHDLDPSAPIQVPGMEYQPPLIGSRQLLNFSAFSFPDTGGMIFALCGFLLVGVVIFEWMKERKISRQLRKPVLIVPVLIVLFALDGCSQSPQPIKYGSDECAYCKMSIMNPKFGGEIVSGKGKLYKFDDAACMVSFLKSVDSGKEKNSSVYLIDFCGEHAFIKPEAAFLLSGEEFKSPMRGNVAAFSNVDSMSVIQEKFVSKEITWDEFKNDHD